MTGMADRPGTPRPAAGAPRAPETKTGPAPQTGTWRLVLAAFGLVAVVGGLAASVVSASGESRPPDLGGPILARGVASTSAPAPTATPPQTRPAPAERPPDADLREREAAAAAAASATPVPIRALPVPVTPETQDTSRPQPATTAAPGVRLEPLPTAAADQSAP